MRRLYNRAFEILVAEVKRCTQKDLAGEVGQRIVMQRLEKLRRQQGKPLTAGELHQLTADQFPNFNPAAIKRAARANRPSRVGKKVLWGGVTLMGLAGFVWLANLPYPMIRQPVLRRMPLLLFPSYISMEHHYARAIASVEQAEELVNQGTTQADVSLSEQKIETAITHLDRLPVKFLGYYPQRYCSLTGCSWKFTLDEYEAARKNIEQLEARIFQEKNAFIQFNEAQSAIKIAKQNYQKSQSEAEQQSDIETWQAAVDLLQKISADTIAGQQAKTQLGTAQQDFREVVGYSIQTQKGNTIIATAREFAILAARASQNPPHSAQRWQEVIEYWENAIEQLEKISLDNPNYLEAQDKLYEYTQNLRTIEGRLRDEEEAVELLQLAKELIDEWREMAQDSDPSISQLRRQLNEVIYILEGIEAGTTVTAEAIDLIRATRNTRDQL
ncbi:MAG: hypothetical protein WBA13_08770 [Microcoleaceae cyanobacterium]